MMTEVLSSSPPPRMFGSSSSSRRSEAVIWISWLRQARISASWGGLVEQEEGLWPGFLRCSLSNNNIIIIIHIHTIHLSSSHQWVQKESAATGRSRMGSVNNNGTTLV